MWSDFGWNSEEFYERCPKSVIQQNWFYDESYGGFDINTNTTSDAKILEAFYKLDKAGFDQVPCGTNWIGWERSKLGVGADDVIGKLVKFGRENISKEHLMGFMMATWEKIVEIHEEALINIGKTEPIEILFEPGQVFRFGDSGPYLYLTQSMLIWLSADHLSIPEPNHTGILDRQTADALRAFQLLNGLPETGELDRKTWKNLSKQFTLSAHHRAANPDS